ncbi:hypothetical protein F0562_002317 [Nyssa sinensis]|uniref:Uncharacterized protein n=1 Tax=Nyssa sinensis TaxID=561372 RepID=A0A5J5C5F8_9ASTE|nr:hypothetical protein F0562_002317 [Nyssa sinensis]
MGALARKKGVLKLVHPGRYVEIHRELRTTSEVKKKNPNQSIDRSDVIKFPMDCRLTRVSIAFMNNLFQYKTGPQRIMSNITDLNKLHLSSHGPGCNYKKQSMGASAKKKGVLKLVHPGRYVEVHRKPITAAEVMRKNPNHCIARPDVFKFPWIVVRPESILLPGNVFYIVPNRTIYHLLKAREPLEQPFSPQDMSPENCEQHH